MFKKYRSRPVVIEVEAIQLTEEMFNGPPGDHIEGITYDPLNKLAIVPTHTGEAVARPGDFLVKDFLRGFKIHKPEQFAMHYEAKELGGNDEQ